MGMHFGVIAAATSWEQLSRILKAEVSSGA
jgi:hypothetical protein